MQASTFEKFGRYILLEKIASGGMAEVFLAKKMGASGVQKFVAIKRILPQYSESEDFISMFKEEAKIAVNLSHSNVISIHEFGVENHQFYLVMEYCEGRNLRQVLNKIKKGTQSFTLSQIVYIIKEVAGGLDHAHRCIDGGTGKPLNIIHRDMSPQNVMVSFEGEVKIVDFGIAKASNQLETTRAGTLKGKFGYMSPEQSEGLQVDYRTDIFSLGIVFWELLASDRLFLANNEVNTLRKIRECKVPSLRKINPNIPVELEKIALKALAKDRNLRYQNSSEFHRDLNRFLNRHDPDFSAQDFSVFVRTLFSQEILESRQRLITYSQYIPEETVAAPAAPKTNELRSQPMEEDLGTHQSSEFNNIANEAVDLATDVDNTKGSSRLRFNTGEINRSKIDSSRPLEMMSRAGRPLFDDRTDPYKSSNLELSQTYTRKGNARSKSPTIGDKIRGNLLTIAFVGSAGLLLYTYHKAHPTTIPQFVAKLCNDFSMPCGKLPMEGLRAQSSQTNQKQAAPVTSGTLLIGVQGGGDVFVNNVFQGRDQVRVIVPAHVPVTITAYNPKTNGRQEVVIAVQEDQLKPVVLSTLNSR